MDHKRVNRIVAAVVFIISISVYIKTLPPTVVYWDVPEHCAASYLLQVQHPPGSPLMDLTLKVASFLPVSPDIAVRMHFLNAVVSSIDITLLYLIIIRFMMMWVSVPKTTFERITLYGSAVIGALALSFSTTFWFNSIETETRNMSFLFNALIIWISLVWYEKEDTWHSDVYLLMIAYLVGLSTGVHIQGMLAFFLAILVFYFKHYKKSLSHFFVSGDFIKFGIVAALIFTVAYPGIVKWFPTMLNGNFMGSQTDFWKFLAVGIVAGAIVAAVYSVRNKKRVLFIASFSFLFILLGYTTYSVSLIRANSPVPMNENNPSSLSRLVMYLDREQYGDTPLLNRRFSNEPDKIENFKKYTSDWDYMWRYQINHMYLRYLGWDFIGRESDIQDAGVKFSQLYGLPLLLGLIGFAYHWKKDPKMAFVMTVFFFLTGLVLAVYFNMQEPQPRERDYFFAPSIWCFCLWIGMGVKGICDYLQERLSGKTFEYAGYGTLALAMIVVPGNMLRTNYHPMSRHGHYLAWDFSYNLLQSCDKDAILITNGDNDTFPLWYLQDVEGVRQDVRVVNMSLGNTDWYILQLKNATPHGALKVPISMSDAQIQNIQPIQYEPRVMSLPVPSDLRTHIADEAATSGSLVGPVQDTIKFLMPATLQVGSIKALRVQDILVYDMVMTNEWKRPIYFASTVSEDCKIGLGDYLQMEGLAFKLVPWKVQNFWSGVNENKMEKELLTDVPTPSRGPALGYRWRGLQDSTVHFDENQRRLFINYRQMFFSLALYEANIKHDRGTLVKVLNRMEEVLPRTIIPLDYRFKQDIASLYMFAQDTATAKTYYTELIAELQPLIASGGANEPLSQYHPYILLANAYQALGMYDKAIETYDVIKSTYSAMQGVPAFVDGRIAELKKLGGSQGASGSTLK